MSAVVFPVTGYSGVADLFYFLLEKILGFSTLTKELELFKIEQASFILIDRIKKFLDIREIYLDAMLLKHLLELLSVKCARAVIIELKENIFNIILSLQL